MCDPYGGPDALGQGDVFSAHAEGSVQDILKLKPDPELDNFLTQVDNISELINSLASEDPNESQKALRKAEILLHDAEKDIDVEKVQCKVKADRTVINKVEDEPTGQGEMGTQAFMRMVEQDAKKRAQDRKERKIKSDEFRKKGNVMFAKKDYAGALCNYNEAIKLIRDSPCLYNNRALTFIRLGIFSSAIEDCKRSLELEEYSLRARLFMAKALFLMGEADQCRDILNAAKEKLQGHVDLINDYEEELFNMGSVKPQFDYDLETEQKWKAAARYDPVQLQKPAEEEEDTLDDGQSAKIN